MFRLIPLPYKLAAIGVVFVAIAFGLWRVHENIWNKGFEAGKIAQLTISKKECDKAQAITTEVSNAYQKKLSALARQLDALRVRPSKCIAVASEAPGGRNAAANSTEHGGQNGVPSTALYEFAAEAERYRLQLIACQTFIEKSD